MHTLPKESVDIPHVWLEVPETDVLQESRTMALALLSEHNYEAVSEHGFTFSQCPRVYEHGDEVVGPVAVDGAERDRRQADDEHPQDLQRARPLERRGSASRLR